MRCVIVQMKIILHHLWSALIVQLSTGNYGMLDVLGDDEGS